MEGDEEKPSVVNLAPSRLRGAVSQSSFWQTTQIDPLSNYSVLAPMVIVERLR